MARTKQSARQSTGGKAARPKTVSASADSVQASSNTKDKRIFWKTLSDRTVFLADGDWSEDIHKCDPNYSDQFLEAIRGSMSRVLGNMPLRLDFTLLLGCDYIDVSSAVINKIPMFASDNSRRMQEEITVPTEVDGVPITVKGVECLASFCTQGFASVPVASLPGVLALSSLWGLKDLKKLCLKCSKEFVAAQNAVPFLVWSARHSDYDDDVRYLRRVLRTFLLRNADACHAATDPMLWKTVSPTALLGVSSFLEHPISEDRLRYLGDGYLFLPTVHPYVYSVKLVEGWAVAHGAASAGPVDVFLALEKLRSDQNVDLTPEEKADLGRCQHPAVLTAIAHTILESVEHPRFPEIAAADLCEILSSKSLNLPSESKFLHVITTWISGNVSVPDDALTKLLGLIGWSYLSVAEIAGIIAHPQLGRKSCLEPAMASLFQPHAYAAPHLPFARWRRVQTGHQPFMTSAKFLSLISFLCPAPIASDTRSPFVSGIGVHRVEINDFWEASSGTEREVDGYPSPLDMESGEPGIE
mmetsp:Transcript_24213/g.41663  ORF Transcript_24213/g.41663 Transcript_24213/m.41663 type:complete len:528 (-) Transcript_24213:120-1703(-)